MPITRYAIASNGYARGEQRAVVSLIFHGDPDGNRLQALKPGARLEVRALFATMQRSVALRASACEVDAWRECRGAIETSRRSHVLYEARQPGSRYIDRRARPLRLLPIAKRPGIPVSILVAVLSVFAVAVH